LSVPHDRPTAEELIESVREWLERDVLPGVEGRLQFHARVAINSLDIVLREMSLGEQQEASHRSRLAALGHSDDASLAASIRAGDHDGDLASLLAALKPSVEDKVRVANPRHLA
jgi:hypothetical protein